jgi:hypothetical protein
MEILVKEAAPNSCFMLEALTKVPSGMPWCSPLLKWRTYAARSRESPMSSETVCQIGWLRQRVFAEAV